MELNGLSGSWIMKRVASFPLFHVVFLMREKETKIGTSDSNTKSVIANSA